MADQKTIAEDLEAAVEQLGLEETHEEESPEVAAEEVVATEEVPAEEAPVDAPETPEKPVGKVETAKIKAPVDWGPKLRQEFAKLPPHIQEKIHSREIEVSNVLQQTARERRTAQQFGQVVSEFRGLMAAEGVHDPIAGVRGLLSTTAQLAMGNQQTKARKIADLIKHYNVDIQTLDALLAGEAPPQGGQFEQLLEQRLAPVNQLLQQIEENKRNQMYQTHQMATQTVSEFKSDPKNEFYEDVRLAMADFLDYAAAHNQPLTLQEAYDRACAMNPEIAEVIMQRRAAGRGEVSAGHAAQKKRAASSVSGRKSGVEDESGGSIRDALKSAMGQSGRI